MQAVINVKGTKLSVLSIHYYTTGEPYTVYAVDENGKEERFIEKSQSQYVRDPHVAVDNLSELLEYPEFEARIVEDNKRLIQFLEDDLKDEKRKLYNILIEMGALKDDAPFSNLADRLLERHSEHALREQKVFGIIDTIEKIKAFSEGYYANVDGEAPETQSSHSTTE